MAKADIEKAPPALAVFGLDQSKKAHGSYFAQEEVARAIKAANGGGLYALQIVGDELSALAAKLPRGKLFDSGNAFVPFVGMAVFEKLLSAGKAAGDLLIAPATHLADRPAKPRAAAAGGPTVASKSQPLPSEPYSMPATWADITVGSLVLLVDGMDDGYFPAVVVHVSEHERIEERDLALRFRDYADYPTQMRKLTEVGLLHPSIATPVAKAKT